MSSTISRIVKDQAIDALSAAKRLHTFVAIHEQQNHAYNAAHSQQDGDESNKQEAMANMMDARKPRVDDDILHQISLVKDSLEKAALAAAAAAAAAGAGAGAEKKKSKAK